MVKSQMLMLKPDVRPLLLVGGFSPTPLKNDGIRQIGSSSQLIIGEVIKFHGSSQHQPANDFVP